MTGQTLTVGPRSARSSALAVPTARQHRGRKFLRRAPLRIVLALVLVIEVYPLVWMFLTSLKSQDDYLNNSTWSLPTHWVWGNYSTAWTTGHIGIYVRNSLIATVPSLFLVLTLGTAAGFALEVMVWKRRSQTLLVFLAG